MTAREVAVPTGEAFEALERRVAALEGFNSSPWLAGAAAAADYLGWPRERVYKRLHEIPHHREGSRLMFRRDELDAYVEGSSSP